jgi:tRNA A-37 threonylcarbamoyl transferase component Bud32
VGRITRDEMEGQLRTLGLGETTRSAEIALDQTITPETFAARFDPHPPGDSVGPLPRISLSGIGSASSSGTPIAPRTDHTMADLEVLSVLGEGGMGRVHLARQRSLGREVAIKTLKTEVADARAVEMLRAEATTMGRLEHPNVVPVHAVGLDDHGRLLLVMKRIDGVAWHDLIHDPSHPRWQTLAPLVSQRLDAHLDVLGQVANALHFAHGRGVVHRDVKPENVLLGEHGEVYLADWGVALRTTGERRSELVGTPLYMAPEMAMADTSKIDARTDVFLLGATLHEILTGAPPHHGRTLHEVLIAAFESKPPVYDESVPAELAGIAARAMAVDPADRFESALSFKHALDTLRRHRGSIALTRAARALLEELGADLAQAAGEKPDVDRKLTECRFAFVSALRDWPENADARAGLDACLVLAVRHELSRENADAARGLLRELSKIDDALADELAALDAMIFVIRA